MRIVGFDLGLANTAFAILEPIKDSPFLAKRVKSGRFTTSPGTLSERLQELAADIGMAMWDPFSHDTEIAIEEQRVGPHTRASSMAILGVVVAAAVYGDFEFELYSPRTWQSEIGVELPPKSMKGEARRDWTKDFVESRVVIQIEGACELSTEHERDAAGIALCHLMKQAKDRDVKTSHNAG